MICEIKRDEINPNKAMKKQEKFCKETGLPLFAPPSGICWNCRKQIYDVIPVEVAGRKLITGCPICHRTYCE